MYLRWIHNYILYLIASLIGGFFYVNTYNNSMAITINQQPTEWQAAYNPIDYVVTSTNYTEDGFKVIVDIVVNGTNLPRLLVPTNPNTNDTNIDVSRMVESYLGFDFDTELNDNNIINCPNSIAQLSVNFGEQYLVAGEVTDFPNLTSSNVVDVLNTSFNFVDFIQVNRNDFYNFTNDDTRFLTNQPNNRTVPALENRWLYLYSDNADTDFGLIRYRTYDSSDTLLNTFDLTNPFNGSDQKVQRFPAGQNINDVSPIINSSVAYVTMQALETTSGNFQTMSELFRFNLDHNCTPELVTLHFQNEINGFDSFSFTQAVKNSWDKVTSNYKALDYARSVGSVDRSLSRHQRRNFDTTTTQRFKLTSNWITESESTWLRELWDSPIVFMERNGVLYAIESLELSSYDEKQQDLDKLFNLEIEVKFSWSNSRQRW